MLMDKRTIKYFNLVYDNLYNLTSRNLNKVIEGKINILLDDLNEEVKKHGYEFKLNQRTQKFKLYVIKK